MSAFAFTPPRGRSRTRGPVRRLRSMSRSRSRSSSRGGRNALVRIPRSKMGFPQSMSATLRFVEKIDFVLTDHQAHTERFRANDLYNPHIGGAIHQPRGFAQYMMIYNTFTVRGSKIKLNWCYEGYLGPTRKSGTPTTHLTQDIGALEEDEVPALPGVVCGLHKATEALSAGDPETQMEKDRTTWKIMTPSVNQTTMTGSLKISDFFGKDALVGSAGYTGDETTSPDNDVYWEVWAGRAHNDPIEEGSNVSARCYLTIEYDAVFTNPKTLGPSPIP